MSGCINLLIARTDFRFHKRGFSVRKVALVAFSNYVDWIYYECVLHYCTGGFNQYDVGTNIRNTEEAV